MNSDPAFHAIKPLVVVIAGANGAGKSTLAPSLLRDTFHLMEYVNADMVAVGLSAFRPDDVAYSAGRIAVGRLRALAGHRVDFAFESTLSGRSQAVWIARLLRHGYQFHLLYLWVGSPELAVQRVRERVRAGGHDVPEAVILRRYCNGLRNLELLYRPLADTWAIYDNELTAPILLATGTKLSAPTVFHQELWNRFCEATGWH